MFDISIVFVNLKMKEDILRAIESVYADILACPYSVAITVADNSQNVDGIKEALAEKFKAVNYVDCGGNVGFGQGNVWGFKTASARYYFCLNRDTLIPPGTRVVERIVQFMDKHPRIGAIGPKLLNLDGSVQANCYRFDAASILIKPLKQINWDKKYNWVRRRADRLLMKDFDHNKTKPVDWVLGAALIVRQTVVDQIGWFDERYLAYMEDCDWCYRMWKAGWPVYYVHDIIIKHGHARASAQVPGLVRALWKNPVARIHAASWLKFLWKWRKDF